MGEREGGGACMWWGKRVLARGGVRACGEEKVVRGWECSVVWV